MLFIGGMMDFAISVKNLSKRTSRLSLEDISFELPIGHSMALLGEKGSGKSTLVKALLQICNKDSGDIKLLGMMPKQAMNDVGVVLSDAEFPGGLNALIAGRICSMEYRNWDSKVFSGYLERLDIDPGCRLDRLSSEDRMKVSFACAMSHNARLLVIDEAPSEWLWMSDMVRSFIDAPGHSALISCSDAAEAEKLCDSAAMIYDGRMLFCDELEHLKGSYRLIEMDARTFSLINRKKLIGARKLDNGAKALVKAGDFNESRYSLSRPSLDQIVRYMIRDEEARNARTGL